ncbi:MAG: hypothetical protein EOO85_23520, partial [Pedobacter sp.]
SNQWVAFLLVNLVAYLAARNTVHRRERRVEANQIQILESERSFLVHSNEELEQLNKECWVMIQKQSSQIDDLSNQLKAARKLHLN